MTQGIGLHASAVLNSWMTTRSYIVGYVLPCPCSNPYYPFTFLYDEINLLRVYEAA